MQETFKNVSIFIVFLASLLLWNVAQAYVRPYFAFQYGSTILIYLWTVSVIIIFNLLYYFVSRSGVSAIYLSTVITLVAVGVLIYLQKLPLS